MTDRRRVNGPAAGTIPPLFALSSSPVKQLPKRTRKANELRKIFLQTGLVPSADGSAYLELEAHPRPVRQLVSSTSTIKLSCTVHGPKPVSRTASFSPNLQLAASVKFAAFATQLRRGYVRDSTERDLGTHLENALKGVIIPDRWPKSSIDVAVTVLEGEEGLAAGDGQHSEVVDNIGLMAILSGCITAASAALVDAKIDCLDLLAGGVAAVVQGRDSIVTRVLDPSAADPESVVAACAVGYLPSRDELTEIWTSGTLDGEDHVAGFNSLLDSAIAAARGSQVVLKEVMTEVAQRDINDVPGKGKAKAATKNDEVNDIEMKT